MMKRRYLLGVALWITVQILYAQGTVTIGKTMYQNQAFTAKDKHIFDTDWEGLRVWRWSKAQNYCEKLKLDGYDGWRVASKKELEKIMTSTPSESGLYVKLEFSKKMPPLGGKYDDVWFWTRDSKSSNVAAFVNFKKHKVGWAEKSYKGYVLCSRNVGKTVKQQGGIVKLKRSILFEYQKKVWRSDMTQKGTMRLGNYSLLYFYCQNFPNASIPTASKLIKHKKTTYFFAYKGKNKKSLNLYRTNGTTKGAKKVGSIGNYVAYSPIWVGDKLYFFSSESLPQQDYPAEEKLWMFDTKTNRLRYMGETVTNNSYDILFPFAQSKTKLFFKRWSYGKGTIAGVWVVDQQKGFKKVKSFKKMPDHLKSIKVAGKNYKLNPLKTLPWGCGADSIQGSFKIEKKSILYKNKQIINLSNVKDLKVYDVKLVFNGEKYAVIVSNGNLWGIDNRGNIKKLKNEKK
ncbi:MAG: hypothetical protein B6D54_04200 [Epsilonproteobacteria bacterium 4484_65]|nr:MAG: hypothetical protein B6D54_04200 [Epsilonproteobacteria bacterium 4484_65]